MHSSSHAHGAHAHANQSHRAAWLPPSQPRCLPQPAQSPIRNQRNLHHQDATQKQEAKPTRQTTPTCIETGTRAREHAASAVSTATKHGEWFRRSHNTRAAGLGSSRRMLDTQPARGNTQAVRMPLSAVCAPPDPHRPGRPRPTAPSKSISLQCSLLSPARTARPPTHARAQSPLQHRSSSSPHAARTRPPLQQL